MPAVCPAPAGPWECDRERTDADTRVQPSGSLRSGDRGNQSITRITNLASQTQGSTTDSSEEGEEASFLGVHSGTLIFLEIGLLTQSQGQDHSTSPGPGELPR